MGVSDGRSWSPWDAFEGKYRQKLTNLLEIDFSNTPTKGLAWFDIRGNKARELHHVDRVWDLQGCLAHKKLPPPPWDHHGTLGIGLLQGPGGVAVSYERGTPVG